MLDLCLEYFLKFIKLINTDTITKHNNTHTHTKTYSLSWNTKGEILSNLLVARNYNEWGLQISPF